MRTRPCPTIIELRSRSPAPCRRYTSFVKGLLGCLGFRDPALHVLNAAGVARMIGKDLRQTLLAARNLLHSFPETHRFLGVVAREGHQEQADVVRLRFF